MKKIIKTTLLSSMFLFTSCATIISGSRQKVEIASEPSSAKVYINGIEVGKTPMQKNLKRNQEYSISLKLDGYQTYETKLEKKFNAWYIGNIVFGGIIGVVVDPVTGAIYKLRPEQVAGELKKGTAYNVQGGKLFIKISMDVDSNLERIGQLKKEK